MSKYLRSNVVRVGLGLLILGTGPLLTIVLLAKLGVLADPNPNPIGLGILAGLTFWPGVLCVIGGIISVARRKT